MSSVVEKLFSGAALAVYDVLSKLEFVSLSAVDRIVILSPATGVTAAALKFRHLQTTCIRIPETHGNKWLPHGDKCAVCHYTQVCPTTSGERAVGTKKSKAIKKLKKQLKKLKARIEEMDREIEGLQRAIDSKGSEQENWPSPKFSEEELETADEITEEAEEIADILDKD